MKRVAVYCGASMGNSPIYRKAAEELGKWLISKELGLVYGGGNVGLMGVLADTVLTGDGEVIGVMPTFLVEREIAHPNLTELVIVEDMHQRKKKMMDLADVYIALPGGPGTLEEISEAISWARVGEHANPCVLLNVNGYYDSLADFFDKMVEDDFLSQRDREQILITASLEEADAFITNFEATAIREYEK